MGILYSLSDKDEAVAYSEDDLVPISALQHYAFCERQCALIHNERQWSENKLTAEGRILHERVHDGETETRPNGRIVRGLRLRSLRLGLTGIADVVELFPDPRGVSIPGRVGKWRPYPIEYKRGRPKTDIYDEVQLCAQAICLEEMLGAAIEEGGLFYGQPRRRHAVRFDTRLRENTESLCLRVHLLLRSGKTPASEFAPKCNSCSLVERCLPKTAGSGKSASRYIERMIQP